MSARRLIALAALLPVIALAACGSSSDSGGATTAGSGGATVSVSSIDGQDVLVDANGAALYTPAQEASGKILCTGECTSIWMPLTTSGGQQPTGDDGATGTLATVRRPDGGSQVTYDGAPLYTFTQEQPGELMGDGLDDAFGGTHFAWHAVTPSGGSSGGAGSDSGSGAGQSGGGGGYSY